MDIFFKYLCLVFAFGCTIHNLEEAILLPAWAKKNISNLPFVPNATIYWILTTIISIFIWLAVWAALTFSDNQMLQSLLLAIALSMAINAIFPHLAISLIKKSYAPGTLSGVLLNMPIGVAIIFYRIGAGFVPNWPQIILFAFLYGVVAFGVLFLWHYKIGSTEKKGGVSTAQ